MNPEINNQLNADTITTNTQDGIVENSRKTYLYRLVRYIPYLLISLEFFYALLNPNSNKDFILKSGITIFLAEIFSIAAKLIVSCVIAFRYNSRSAFQTYFNSFIGIVLFIALIYGVFQFSGEMGSIIFGINFTLSTFCKLVQPKLWKLGSSGMLQVDFLIQSGILMATISPLIIFAEQIGSLIAFPISLLPTQQTGVIFNDYPQVMLLWGLLYFFVSFLIGPRVENLKPMTFTLKSPYNY